MATIALTSFCVQANDNVIKLIVPFGVGGPTDRLARLIAKDFKDAGRQVVVENKPGANGDIASQFVSSAPVETTVLLMMGTTLNFASKQDEFQRLHLRPVAEIGVFPFTMVVPATSELKTLKDWKTKNPKKNYTYSTSGKGSISYLAGTIVANKLGKEGIDVPYPSIAKQMVDLLAGRIDFAVLQTDFVLPYITSGQLIAIASMTEKRHPNLPQVPTFQEQGISGMTFGAKYFILSNLTTNTEDIQFVQKTLTRILNDPTTSKPYRDEGAQISPGSKALDPIWLRQEVANTANLLQKYNLKLN